MTSGRQSALVVRMTAELGVGPEAVAAALHLRREEVELALERYEESTSRDGTRSRCPGWQLVVRRAVLADGERAAADRHLQLCEPCTRAERRRARAAVARRGAVGAGGTSALLSSGRVRAAVVMAAVLTAGALVVVGDVPLLGGDRASTSTATSTGAARGSAGQGPADATGPAAVPDGGGEAPGTDGGSADGAGPDGTRPDGTPADGPPADGAPAGGAPGSGGRAGGTGGSPDDGAGSGARGPRDGGTAPDRGSGGTSGPPAASGLLLGPADRYSAGRTDVAGFLRSRGHVPVADVSPVDRDDLLGRVAAATRPGAGLAVVLVVATPELTLGGEPALDVDGVEVTAAELSQAVGRRRVLLVLDLVGSAQVSLQPLVDALAGPDRFVVAALSNQADDLPVRTAVDGGASAFSELFWREALIGGAGDTDDDGRVSVEEAYALARESAPVTALSAVPVASDRLAGETAVTGR